MALNGGWEKIKQGLTIGIILFGILAAPAQIKIAALESRICEIEKVNKEQIIYNDKKYSQAAVIEIQLNNIYFTLEDIKEQLKDCRLADKEFRDKMEIYFRRK